MLSDAGQVEVRRQMELAPEAMAKDAAKMARLIQRRQLLERAISPVGAQALADTQAHLWQSFNTTNLVPSLAKQLSDVSPPSARVPLPTNS